MSATDPPVILLVAEAVTLAHYGRILSLARALPPECYRVVVAADPRYTPLDPPAPLDYRPLASIEPARFSAALAQGQPLYDEATLAAYVEADLALLHAVRPDVIIGDFRLSLAVSAPLVGVPYAALVNAYWSPYAETGYPVPDLPFTRVLGLRLGQALFDIARPLAFALHARPLNRLRRHYGLGVIGHDLRRVYTWGDYTLYADAPEVVPTRALPSTHRYLGPVTWSAPTPLPVAGAIPEARRPIVLLTLGSSGRTERLEQIVRALARLPITLLVATAGRSVLTGLPGNVVVVDYLPLATAIERARLLICNGGSLTTYQALAAGVPVLGLAANMDQMLNMQAVARLGAGRWLRAARASPAAVCAAAARLLDDPSTSAAAQRTAARLRAWDAGARLCGILDEILARRSRS